MAAVNRGFHVTAVRFKTPRTAHVAAKRQGIGAGRVRWINRPKRFDAFGHGGSHKAKR